MDDTDYLIALGIVAKNLGYQRKSAPSVLSVVSFVTMKLLPKYAGSFFFVPHLNGGVAQVARARVS
jgi:hypothetical protein